MSLKRRRVRGEKPKATVDMTSLIDLTFLLLVTFIVTLPALELGVTVQLPQGKTNKLPSKDNKANTITIDDKNNITFHGDKPLTLDELRAELERSLKEDPDLPVLIRGDERLNYGSIMDVVKILNACKVSKMALVTKGD